GHVLSGPPVRDVRDLPAHLARSASPIVMVDLDPEPHQVLLLLERVVARFPGSRFVGLSTSMESNLLLEAMQAGIRRVVVKQTMAAELRGVLDRLSGGETSDKANHGDAWTILSASGGCGATTFAVNVAEELALEQKQPTL